ncbi:MAG: PAS domain-containing sensor histidine kinase [Hyphomicrobiales bacterium]|nr:PAS domain-containing sensor histidine kinase [Hyphomicrobiales bacterium]MDE2113287.1 PAS domain-containing sensor histidine kinase [Hyphomicrobiales bacterium]
MNDKSFEPSAAPSAGSVPLRAPAGAAYSGQPRRASRLGIVAIVAALVLAVGTFLIFNRLTPIIPDARVVQILLVVNVLIIFTLLAMVIWEAVHLYWQWRGHAAGSGLHLRIVTLFSIIAAAPAVLMAVVGLVTVQRSLNPGYMQDVQGMILDTVQAARLFREAECSRLLGETRLTAIDLDHGKVIYDKDPELFRKYFASRATFLGFKTAVMMKSNGEIIDRGDQPGAPPAVTPQKSDFADALKNDQACLLLDGGRTFVALASLTSFPDVFLYAARPVDPLTAQFPMEANQLERGFQYIMASRGNLQIAFAIFYALLALLMMLSSIWIGLAFANRLVNPIRRLIAATDQVASGNLYVRVPIIRSEGDLAHLGETFNKMTSELRLQQNGLMSASQILEERHAFTEAVLSGVPVAVIGVDEQGRINVLNPSALNLLGLESQKVIGQNAESILPELAAIMEEARTSSTRLVQGQMMLSRQGRERVFNVRVTGGGQVERRLVITLDDITDLASAQRTAAWADVARRIAHEIKNPLTPIQLSADRLKRKYGRVIVEDREIFDQCTDTIIRQVEDIKRMVDEFSSFARMPKPRLEVGEVNSTVAQAAFLMRNGHPDIDIETNIPQEPIIGRFDRHLISQALTNIVKNATEGLASAREAGTLTKAPKILISLTKTDANYVWIDVIDNGVGFPSENRQSLLEPYVTTRAEGTGLGLPIVAKILEDHGGGIQLLDAPHGRGARVAMYFPAIVDETAHPPPKNEATAAEPKLSSLLNPQM